MSDLAPPQKRGKPWKPDRRAAQIAGQSLKMTAACLWCRKRFGFYPACARGKFCSQACKNDWQWENVTKPAVIDGTISRFSYGSIRRYLTERDGRCCSECPQTDTWNGKPLQLEIDHIDGNNANGVGANLRYLCPNCHSQQPTSYKNKRFQKSGVTAPCP